MTKHKHTPGPWACSPNDDTATFPLEVWCRDDPRILVCRVQQHDPGAAQANAHLIAAAPDLLRACEVALECADMSGAVRAMLTDAVEKARGGA